jgi:hypothetical protein
LTTPPSSSAPIPDVNGNWLGTIESPSFPTKNIAARFIQPTSDCIDGSWNTNPPDARWIGAISVYAYPGIVDGNMSFEIPGTGSKQCSGVGLLHGDATNDTATLTWNISTYDTANCNSATVPNQITMRLHR